MRISCLHPFIREIPQLVDELGLPVRQVFPCGKCPVCRSKDAKDWMLRLQYEADNSINPSFLTLTYNEKNVVRFGSVPVLVKRDLQLFVKRLRRRLEREFPHLPPFRFFGVGEYGGNTGRPHYHVICFNMPPIRDARKIIESCWQKGFITYDAVSPSRIAYVASYANYAQLFVDDKDTEIPPTFRVMSRRPGIGAGFTEDRRRSAFYRDGESRGITYHGIRYRFPRYFRDRIFFTEESRLRLQTDSLRFIENEDRHYEQVYGQFDEDRVKRGLPTVREEAQMKFLDDLRKKYIIHKLHRKL